MDGSVLGIPAYSDHEAFSNLIEALKVAESAARQLALYRNQPQWILFQSAIETTRHGVTALALGSLK